MRLKNGLVQIYTGCGKGKTTAAFGLAMRGAGAGLKVYVMQFIKSGCYNEVKTIKKIPNITIEQCGRGCFIKRKPSKKDIECASGGMRKVLKKMNSKKYGIVILDEVNVALSLGLIKKEFILELIKNKPKNVELVLTGRYCPRYLFKKADLITEMREIKHPYKKGITSRIGIEC